MHKHLLAAILVALFAAPAFAADAPPEAAPPRPAPPPPPPVSGSPELASLDFFVGTWTCTGKAFANPMGPEHATTATVHAARSVGNAWLHINYDENKTKANATPFHVGVYMGYDAAAKKFVQGCVDSFGGYCTQSSSGWDGDKLVFEGTAKGSGADMGVRDTFVKKGANELTHAGEMQGADKKWAPTDEESCKRTK
jgi:hypothetical protein